MSNKNYNLSPASYHNNKSLLPQNNLNYIKLEKEILHLINYLRINPEKYLIEYNDYFENGDIDTIINEVNKLEIKLYQFKTKKEISQAGKDFLDYFIENTTDNSYFNFNNKDRTCFNLRSRLSKYGKRYGRIFESIIMNSSCAEEIVNKLLRDEKSRNMILSPKMKYIGITCGYLPKWNNICTVIDIIQDFTVYKDINNGNINNSIQIINTIDFDENENNSENKEQKELFITYKIKDDNNNYCSKTLKNNKLSNNNENNDNKKNVFERKQNYNCILSRNYNKFFNSTISGKSKLISPLATYKSDAHLIFNQSHSNLLKSFSSMKRVNSDLFHNNNNNYDLTTNTHFSIAGNNYRNSHELYNNKINTTNKKGNEIQNAKKIEVRLKNLKENKNNNEYKENINIINPFNEIKNKIIKNEEKKEIEKINENEKEKKNENENQLRNSNFTLKNIDFKKNNYHHKNNNENTKKEIKKNDIKIDLKKNNNTNNDINNYNISFDNNTYRFLSKDNQNTDNVTNDNDNLTIDQINNTSVLNQNKKQNFIFPHGTEINNLLFQKEKNNQLKNKIDLKDNFISDNIKKEKNKPKIESKNIIFKSKLSNIINITDRNINLNEDEKKNVKNLDEMDDYDNEDYYCLKDKKEIKQLIRLYNKERYERKNKNNNGIKSIHINEINNIDNNDNHNEIINDNNNENNNNTDGNNKKSTATFFYINKDKKDNKNIQVYHKQKVKNSNSYNKDIKNRTNKNNSIICNASHKNIISKKFYIPKNILTEINDDKNNDKSNITQNNNILLTENNSTNNIYNINYNAYNEKKRIYSYKTNRSKLFKNRSYGNYYKDNFYKNIEEKQYLSDKNINDLDDNLYKSPKYQFKRISNGIDNIETNVNSDNNNNDNDYADEIIKLNGYKCNKKELKEIDINYIYYNRNNNNTSKENYIYKKNKVIPEKKNSFNYYSKGFNKNIKTDINEKYNITKKICHINQNRSKKKYIIPYINTVTYNEIKK